RGPTAEKADHRHGRLLPPGALHLHREQQTAAADQGKELTPRCVKHGLLPGTRCPSLPQAQDAPEALQVLGLDLNRSERAVGRHAAWTTAVRGTEVREYRQRIGLSPP